MPKSNENECLQHAHTMWRLATQRSAGDILQAAPRPHTKMIPGSAGNLRIHSQRHQAGGGRRSALPDLMQIDAGVTALSDCRSFQCLNHIGFADPSADVDLATAARGALGIVSDARA